MFLAHWNGESTKCPKSSPCMLGTIPKSEATAQHTLDSVTSRCRQIPEAGPGLVEPSNFCKPNANFIRMLGRLKWEISLADLFSSFKSESYL